MKADEIQLPKVTVIVLNCNGLKHLPTCFSSLREIDYPKDSLELMLVDNASTDGSVKYIKENFPEVRIICNEHNYGFSRANNIGAREAKGDFVAFLNNDMRVDRLWLLELVKPLLQDGEAVCTSSKILNWKGDRIDYAGTILNFYGHAWQVGQGSPRVDDYNEAKPTLAPCGGAMLIDKNVFLEAGGFDEEHFFYFEDVDLGWRLWILGYKVLFVPRSIAYHVGHASWPGTPDAKKLVLYERNALYNIVKNYEDKNLEKILPVALMLQLERAYLATGINSNAYRLDYSPASSPKIKRPTFSQRWKAIRRILAEEGIVALFKKILSRIQIALAQSLPASEEYERIPGVALSYIIAANDLARDYHLVLEKRRKVQAARKRPDREIVKLFLEPFTVLYRHPEYEKLQEKLSKIFDLNLIFEKSPPD